MDFTKLENFLDWLTEWRIPGVDCVVYKDGKKVFRHMAGYADVEKGIKLTGDETYNMWSVSKPVTAAAAMILYERGKFLLTDPLYEYLPEFRNMMVSEKDSSGNKIVRPAKSPITIGQVMSMTSGLDYTLIESEHVKRVGKETDGRYPTRDVIRAIGNHNLVFDPGTGWCYGVGLDVTAALIEVVSGMRFSDFVKKEIFDPLGMKDSTFRNDDKRIEARMARQYSYDMDKNRYLPTNNSNGFIIGPDFESGGAGLRCTTEDYGLFAAALANNGTGVNGERILAPSTVRVMHTNVLNEKQVNELYAMMGHKGYGYGMGVRSMVDPAGSGAPSPLGEFGWAGAAGSYVLMDTDNNLALFYSEHMLTNFELYITPRLRNILYACF